MADFLELALRRQSCRSFSDVNVEHEKLVKCVEAARQTPSGCNSQPWSFVVVEDPKVVSEVAKTTQQVGLNDYTSKAKAFFVVVEEPAVLIPKVSCVLDGQVFAKGDLGAATYGLTLEAESLGLGTCILGMFDRPKLRELLDIPNYKSIFLVVAVGYPASDRVRSKQRKDLEAIARFI
jgi:nitroreductase